MRASRLKTSDTLDFRQTLIGIIVVLLVCDSIKTAKSKFYKQHSQTSNLNSPLLDSFLQDGQRQSASLIFRPHEPRCQLEQIDKVGLGN